MHRIKPQSRRRAAIRSHPKFVISNAASRCDSSRVPRDRHRYARPRRAAPDNHPRSRNNRRSSSVRRRHYRSRRNRCPTENRWHRSAPLRLHSYRKKNYKACEDDLANHGSHRKARAAEPVTNNLAHLQGCAQSTIGFNPIPSLLWSRPQSASFNQEKCFSAHYQLPLPTSCYSLFPIPHPLHCAITIPPWNGPQIGSKRRSRPSLHRPQFNPLRLCRMVRTPLLIPKTIRGIVPFVRSGWNRGAAN